VASSDSPSAGAHDIFLRFRFGTFAPLRRASDKPIAIACFLRLTFLPERADLSFPLFRSRLDRATLVEASRPYFRPDDFAPIK
jgi:hypothetical protein